jgi:hypothetical protein
VHIALFIIGKIVTEITTLFAKDSIESFFLIFNNNKNNKTHTPARKKKIPIRLYAKP